MIDTQKFKKMISQDANKLPFLTIDEFFAENTDEYAIAPNQCDEGRPSLTEMYQFFGEIEKNPAVEWIRVSVHCDTQIIEKNRTEKLELYGDTIVICANETAENLEKYTRCDWLCSDGIVERKLSDYENFSFIPPIKKGNRLFEIWWD